MNFTYHTMPSLLYRRPAHVKWDEFVEALKKVSAGQSMIVSGFKEDFKIMQMRVRATIVNRGFDPKEYRVLKSEAGILVERKKRTGWLFK